MVAAALIAVAVLAAAPQMLVAARRRLPIPLFDTCPAPPDSLPAVPPAQRLVAALSHWQSHSRWAASIVEHGLAPEWLPAIRPPRILKPDSHTLCQKYGGAHVEGMTKEIQKLIDLGSVKPVPPEEDSATDSVTSIMFPVPKQDGRTRPVINLKTINPYVRAIPFKMEGLKTVQDLLRKDWWMVKVDLADAFHHIPLHPRHQQYFRFRWKGTFYQWQVMPFGYRDAPRIFTKMMAVVAKEARKMGLRLVVYIDDILIMAPTREAAIRDRDSLMLLLRRFGFTLNIPKSVLTPSQLMEFLGIMIDSRTMTFSLPTRKVEKILELTRTMARRAAANKHTDLIDLQRLIGTLQSVTPCVLPTRLHTNSLIEHLRLAECHPRLRVTLGPSAMADLSWWQHNLMAYNGRPIVPRPPDRSLDTDASGKGWGAIHINRNGLRQECQGFFTSVMHSNTRELTAISLGVQSLAKALDWKDCSVRVRTDNQCSMSYINRMGGREPHLSRITEQVHNACLARRIYLTAEYLPGLKNGEADKLSRIESNWAESHLARPLYRLVDRTWGPHSMDAFASATNHQCPRYVSLRLDHNTMYTDFLSHPVNPKENVWAFPPFAMIGRVMRKVEEEGLTLTLLIPIWPAQPWWPLFPALLSDYPLLLPHHQHPISTWVEGVQQHHCPSWQWAALRLCGLPSSAKAFRAKLSTLHSQVTSMEKTREQCVSMTLRGCDGSVGPQQVAAARLISLSLTSLIT